MNFVLDASVTLAWAFEGEGGEYARDVLARLEREEACTTALWPFEQTHLLARRWALSAYDAHYLELAIRYGIPLATLDEGLRQAAENEGVRGPLA
jgi:predicted nucleic acid-binding protein